MPLIWSGLPYMRERKLHSLEMPNSMNFAFSYYIFAQVRQLVLISPDVEEALDAERMAITISLRPL